MAGDQDSDIVGPVGRARRAHRPGLAGGGGDLGVGTGLARRDLAQLGPDALLERGAAHVERDVGAGAGMLDRADHPLQQRGELGAAFDQFGIGEARGQLLAPFGERQAAHALIGRGHQHRPERGLHHRPVDRHAFAAADPGRGRHAQLAVHQIVEPRSGFEPGLVDRLGHRTTARQRLTRPLLAQRAGIGGGRKAGGAGETRWKCVGE